MNETEGVTLPYGLKTALPKTSPWDATSIFMLAGLVLLIFLVTWLYLAYRSRVTKKKKVEISESPWTLLSRDAKAAAVPLNGTYEEWLKFSSDVSVLSRRAVGLALKAPVEDWTTEECHRYLTSDWVLKDVVLKDNFIAWLKAADRVRFAAEIPSSNSNEWKEYLEHVVSRCQEFATRPAPLVTEQKSFGAKTIETAVTNGPT